MYLPLRLLAGLGEGLEKVLAGSIIDKNVLAPVTPVQDVVAPGIPLAACAA